MQKWELELNLISGFKSFHKHPEFVYLVVDEAPLLEEGVHAHDGAHVAGQVPPARRRTQVLRGVQPVGVDHEVPVGQVDLRRLGHVLAVEELWQVALLDAVDGVVVEPGAVARDYNVVGLFGDVILGLLSAFLVLFLNSRRFN